MCKQLLCAFYLSLFNLLYFYPTYAIPKFMQQLFYKTNNIERSSHELEDLSNLPQQNKLIKSIINHDTAAFETLMHATPDLEEKLCDNTPLDWSILRKNYTAFSKLVVADKKLTNHKNSEGYTPLMLACKIGLDDCYINPLLKAGVNPGVKDNNNTTCMEYAMRSNTPTESILMLIELAHTSLEHKDYDKLLACAQSALKDQDKLKRFITSQKEKYTTPT